MRTIAQIDRLVNRFAQAFAGGRAPRARSVPAAPRLAPPLGGERKRPTSAAAGPPRALFILTEN